MACSNIAVAQVRNVSEAMLIEAGAVELKRRTREEPGLFAINLDQGSEPVMFVVGRDSCAAYIREGGGDPTLEGNRLRAAVAKVGGALDGTVECHRGVHHEGGVVHTHKH